jgi:hypothetical protein
LKTPRDAYLHFKKMGTMLQRTERSKKHIHPYRLPVATTRKKTPDTPPPTRETATTHILPAAETIVRPFSQRRLSQPAVVRRVPPQFKPTTLTTTPYTARKTQHRVRQPKPGELVLNEPPSSYFRKICTIGPPKYLTDCLN